ncbi:helix-turn-helix domain-containing protein [Woeseia oceani]|uniref:Excisionase n=1 Tax=Woeseia oceani TaxID=1548547 RepID=A0A193LJP1_9GAMM|nr:helix-turn-helix domain-containing protein [Woeseia oceani]ANO52648.1 excisionase [Woeseia oceani]
MTISASYAEKIGDRLPSASEREAANHLRKILAAHASPADNSRLKIVDPAGKPTEVFLTPALSELLIELLRHIGKGDAVTLVPVTQRLTTQQAADLLNVSRPYFVGLLEKGEMPFELVGRHRRVRANDLFEYKSARDSKRAKALDELAQLDADYI